MRLRTAVTYLIVATLLSPRPLGVGRDETAPMVVHRLDYPAWSFPSLSDEKVVDLRAATKDARLIWIVYFAPWCENWLNQAPIVKRMHERYGDRGLKIILIAEYESGDKTIEHLDELKLGPIAVIESTSRDDRENTEHYRLRKLVGDERKWGTPWNVVVESSDVVSPAGSVGQPAESKGDKKTRGSPDQVDERSGKPKRTSDQRDSNGDRKDRSERSADERLAVGRSVPFARRVRVSAGEIVESELEQLIRERLGLTADSPSK